MAKEEKDAAPGEVVVSESHYHSKKDRVFVRAIQGQPVNVQSIVTPVTIVRVVRR